MDLFSQRPVYIYTLSCPDSNMVKYVGKTHNPQNRKSAHFNPKDKYKTKKDNWVRFLIKHGKLPIWNIIDERSLLDWEEKERQYIKIFKSCGANLLNIAPGGGGVGCLGFVRSKEQKENISQKMKLVKKTPEHNKNVSDGLKEWWKKDSSVKQKQIERLRAYNSDPYHRQRVNESKKTKRIINDEIAENLVKLRNQKLTLPQISEKTGIKYHLVQNAILRYKKEHGLRK